MKKLFLLLLVFVSYAGCKYEPEQDLTPGKTVPPKAGSTFTFKNVQTDTTGKPIDSTITYTRDSVIETGVTFDNKTNVTHFISIDIKTGTVLTGSDFYYNYESNGDVSINTGVSGAGGFLPGLSLPDWITYPMQSHTTIGFKFLDTTVNIPGVPLPIPIKGFDSIFFVNNGVYTGSGDKIPIFNSKNNTTFIATIFFAPLTVNNSTHISFAPSLGYNVSEITDPTIIPNGLFPSQGGNQKTLTAYTLIK
jgi:hypothetical protein